MQQLFHQCLGEQQDAGDMSQREDLLICLELCASRGTSFACRLIGPKLLASREAERIWRAALRKQSVTRRVTLKIYHNQYCPFCTVTSLVFGSVDQSMQRLLYCRCRHKPIRLSQSVHITDGCIGPIGHHAYYALRK